MILKLTKEPKQQQSSSIPPFCFFLLDVNPSTPVRVTQNGMDLSEVLFTREQYRSFWDLLGPFRYWITFLRGPVFGPDLNRSVPIPCECNPSPYRFLKRYTVDRNSSDPV